LDDEKRVADWLKQTCKVIRFYVSSKMHNFWFTMNMHGRLKKV